MQQHNGAHLYEYCYDWFLDVPTDPITPLTNVVLQASFKELRVEAGCLVTAPLCSKCDWRTITNEFNLIGRPVKDHHLIAFPIGERVLQPKIRELMIPGVRMKRDGKKVALVIGGSRGIGRQIAIDLAKNDYYVVVAAKTTSDAYKTEPFPPNPNSSHSTINTVAREIKQAGDDALALPVDVRDFTSVTNIVDETVRQLGSLDVLVYNSGAIWWASVEETPMKRFQLMERINPEGLYGSIQAALPHWKKQDWDARIIVVSPPIYSRFFHGKTAYAMGKVGMSVLTKGLAIDFVRQGRKNMAITSIWPASAIESAATGKHLDSSVQQDLRKPTIFSDAILAMLKAPAGEVNGLIDTDEDFLRKRGVTDFSQYSMVPGSIPRRIMPAEFPTLEVTEQNNEGQRLDSTKLTKSKL